MGVALPLLNELTVRPKDGSEALTYVQWRGSEQDYNNSPRRIIFVHGFNTSELGALDSYRKFLGLLSAGRLGSGGSGKAPPSFWAFYWPGDHTNKVLKAVDAPGVYNSRKESANTSGESLAELIMRMPPEREVMLVGHSMGCRVVLEAIYRIARMRQDGKRGAQVTAVCLMAAAVPVGMCDGDEARYRRREGEPTELVLYSAHDGVLGGNQVLWGLGKLVSGFKVAEWLYDSREGPAVGATGQPERRWLDPRVGTNRPVPTRLGHTEYWDSDESATLVGRFLGGRPASRSTGKAGPEELTMQRPRREQAARKLGSRELGPVRELAWQDCFPAP